MHVPASVYVCIRVFQETKTVVCGYIMHLDMHTHCIVMSLSSLCVVLKTRKYTEMIK